MKYINKNTSIVAAIGIIIAIVVVMFAFNAGNDQVDVNRITGFGTDFSKQIFNVNLDVQPNDTVTMTFEARISQQGTGEYANLDYFCNYLTVNGVGGFSQTLGTWTNVRIDGTEFKQYSVVLPADLNNDGIVDWKKGENSIDMRTWSYGNSRPGKTEVSWIEFTVP